MDRARAAADIYIPPAAGIILHIELIEGLLVALPMLVRRVQYSFR